MQRIAWLVLAAGALCACRDRESDWDVAPVDPSDPTRTPPLELTVGLTGSVAAVDKSLDRLLMFTVPSGFDLETTVIPLGPNPSVWQASPDRRRLFVLTRGVDTPEENVEPTLTVVAGGTRPAVCNRFALDVPHSRMVIDPQGEWVVLHDASAFVRNTSELVLARLHPEASCHNLSEDERESEVINKTLRSELGDVPQQMFFTKQLSLPGGDRRTLLVQRDESIQLLDLEALLDDPETEPLTIPMSEPVGGETAMHGTPVETAVYPGGTETVPYAWFAVRMANQSDILLVELRESDEDSSGIEYSLNLAPVGAVPSDIEWVITDRGLRLAALTPLSATAGRAVLVDPYTSVTQSVDLPAAYDRMSLITDDVSGASDVERIDQALLWTDYEPVLGFWDLDQTGTRLFASVDARNTGIAMSQVIPVTQDPEGELRHLRILRGHNANEFRLLDLAARTDTQLEVEGDASFQLVVAPDARRVWVYPPAGSGMVVSPAVLPEGHSEDLFVELAVEAVHDIARRDGGRAALVMHRNTTATYSLGTTVFDAETPQSTETRFYGSLLLGGLR